MQGANGAPVFAMIVATAGHVDHGKTSLVKALTQVDTDTLEEERRRGMTIDLGFAYADFGEALPMGFVDVPGHERFIRNMLAGVACIDLGLMVIAADDGPMPQTREHLSILTLLGVSRLVVALTKVDRVSPERRAAAVQEIACLLGAGPFARVPVFAVVATTGDGVPALRQHLVEAGRSLPSRSAEGHFRLAVDRSFIVAGAGRVVTGAALSGSVCVGDRVVVSPNGAPARVRGIRAQNRRVDRAVAGQRCALNLVGADLRDGGPVRGDWVVAPGAHAPTDRLDVRIEVPNDASRALPRSAAWQLHIGAAAVNAKGVVLDGSTLAPGASGLVQLVLERPIAAVHGDRFILRDAGSRSTLAGGIVLDPFAPARGRARPARAKQLQALAQAAPVDALADLLADAPHGVDLRLFALARNVTGDEADRLHRALSVQVIDAGTMRWGVSADHWRQWRERIVVALQDGHASEPDSVGPSEAALGERVGLARAPALLHAAVASLVAEGRVAREGLRCRLAGHRARLSAADAGLLARVAACLAPAGLRPPIVGELAVQLEVPQPQLLDFLARASQLGALVQVAPNRFYLPATVAELAAHATQLAGESDAPGFDAAAYRDRTGIGRNLTIQVLEFLDREGLTRFDGRRRRLAMDDVAQARPTAREPLSGRPAPESSSASAPSVSRCRGSGS